MRSLPLRSAALVAALVLILIVPAHAADRAQRLQRQILAVLARHAGQMRVGVTIIDPASGERVDVHDAADYPLASVFKVPVMIELARQIQTGRPGLTLASPLILHESDKVIGAGQLRYDRDGSRASIRRCVELMITISDNTAADLIYQRVGQDSPDRLLRTLGLAHTHVYLTNRQAYLISLGMVSGMRGLKGRDIARKWLAMSPAERRRTAALAVQENRGLTVAAFQHVEDVNAARKTGWTHADDVAAAAAVDNLGSPRDMAELLLKLYQGKILDPRWTAYCMGVLGRQQYNSRIPRRLPAGAHVYHKTGTDAGVVNDAGIIRYPDGHVLVMAAFARNVAGGNAGAADAVIGEIARLAYDEYKGQSPGARGGHGRGG